ncbi:FAD-binding protein [Kingella negevensis]|uniref:FAD-binding protein n=1 Tax=Kingella negevensis TaxID=1522312 RepID=UPI002550EF15|nr:FAD-binding protein [Kingella negevensis]MDK4684446.1 FAD-binding protein [Kingella negevensis]
MSKQQKFTGVPYETALANLRAKTPELNGTLPEKEVLLKNFHPDHSESAHTTLTVGANVGDSCHPDLAKLLTAHPLIEDADLAGAENMVTDVLVIGGGGAGAAAALTAVEEGARVIMANKLRIGDSNTVMAEGGIQAAVGADDSPQRHFEDTFKGGHQAANKELVAQMVMDAPSAIRWLIGLGMDFDTQGGDRNGLLVRKKAGGTTAQRILCHRDFTGLEMMKVLREAVDIEPRITQLNRHPAVELLSDGQGRCVGAVLYDLEKRKLVTVHAKAVILATGGSGRLHLQGFATSNHYGATADGLVLAYRMGAKLRDVDSFQYHPTGVAHPPHLAGALISEATRSAGTKLVNGLGERFVDELQPRDVVAAAILREVQEGRGVERDGQVGVFLDTPRIIAEQPDILKRLVTLGHVAHKCGVNPAEEPLIIHPTLHYQNGGVEINRDCETAVQGLYAAGEVSGGIHGRNRLMGNALLDIISFGRRAGRAAAHAAPAHKGRGGLAHVHDFQRAMQKAGVKSEGKAPVLYPDYGTFDWKEHAGLVCNID